ncbi:MAG: ABC transporter permease [Anaerolineae bacterium]
MRNALTIAGKELNTYFVSPVAYVVTAAFLVITGYFFSLIVFYTREASLRGLFHNMAIILLLISPALTMRLLAEEQRMGTIELLLTSPVRDWEVVLGKFLASLTLFAVMLALTLSYPLILKRFGNPDLGPLLGGYLGILLLGGAFLSVGLFTSSLTQNQIVAAILGFGALLILWLADLPSGFLGASLRGLFDYLALSGHFDDFTKGVIDTQHVIYYLSVIAAFLFLSTRVLETRRWR